MQGTRQSTINVIDGLWESEAEKRNKKQEIFMHDDMCCVSNHFFFQRLPCSSLQQLHISLSPLFSFIPRYERHCFQTNRHVNERHWPSTTHSQDRLQDNTFCLCCFMSKCMLLCHQAPYKRYGLKGIMKTSKLTRWRSTMLVCLESIMTQASAMISLAWLDLCSTLVKLYLK